MRFSAKQLVAVMVLPVVVGLTFRNCPGVAHFDSDGNYSDGVEAASTASQSGLDAQIQIDLGTKHTELVAYYNEGVDEFETAINDKVQLPTGLDENYIELGDRIVEIRDIITFELSGYTEAEADELDAELDKLRDQAETMRSSLAKAVADDAKKKAQSSSSST